MTVAAVEEDVVQLDANHPLAGKALTFELELVGIVRMGLFFARAAMES